MPRAPKTLCQCGGIKTSGVCGKCGAAPRKRKSRHQRGYGNDWARMSQRQRQMIPVCIPCWDSGSPGRLATSTHHIQKIRHAPHLRLEPDNLLTVCQRCHNELDELYEADRGKYDGVIAGLKKVRDSLT